MSQATESPPHFGGRRDGNILEFYTEEFKPEASPVEIFRRQVIQ
jgi:hypothetical protein